MPLGEIYLKLSVTFPDDPKVRALARYGVDGILARDLYVQMCLHCKRMLTDGFILDEQVGLLAYPLPPDHANQLAKQLASVGLVKEVSKTEANDKQDPADGWQVLAYLKRNGTKEDVEELSKVRAEAGRAGGIKSRKRPAQSAKQANRKQVANQAAQQNESNAVSVSVRPNGLPEDRDLQTPTVSADEGLTITQRAKRMTDAYAELVPLCKWPAINGIAIRAIKTEKYTDDVIGDALLRLAADGRSVTTEELRIEIEGLPAPRQRASQNGRGRQESDEERFTRQMERARAREANS